MLIMCSALKLFEAYAAKPLTAHSKIGPYKLSSLSIDISLEIPFNRRSEDHGRTQYRPQQNTDPSPHR